MPHAPTLLPADSTVCDAFSGGADILRASGLKGPYVHFSREGPPDAALDVDAYAPGTSSSGFELRQGRAMEVAPLVEVRTPDAHERAEPPPYESPGSRNQVMMPPLLHALLLKRAPNTLFYPRRHQNIPSNYKYQVTLPQQATKLAAIPHERLKPAFGFRSTPYTLPVGEKGTTPAALVIRRHIAVARAANATASSVDAPITVALMVSSSGRKGEKRKREKKAKKEKKEEKRRRRDNGPDASGLSGPTEISGDTRMTSQ